MAMARATYTNVSVCPCNQQGPVVLSMWALDCVLLLAYC